MDINNLLRGVGATPSKGLGQNDASLIRKTGDNTEESSVATGNQAAAKVTLTDTTNRMRQLSQAAAKQPEVNSDRVAQIKSALADGSYKIQPSVIAARLMAFEAVLNR